MYKYFSEKPASEEVTSPSLRLLRAAQAGSVQGVADAVAAGGDVHTVNEGGNKPIHLAAYEGHVAVLEALIEHGVHHGVGGGGARPVSGRRRRVGNVGRSNVDVACP